MSFKRKSIWLHLPAIALFSLCTTCGGKSGGAAAIIACSLLAASLNGSSLTVGLSQGLLDAVARQGFTQDTEATNVRIQEILNQTLKTAGLGSQLQIKRVASVPAEEGKDDGVRFLDIGGNLAPGVSFASSLLKSIAFQSALSEKLELRSNAFDFVQDSFRVYTTGRETPTPVDRTAAQTQWAYVQTDLVAAKDTANNLANQQNEVVVAVIDTGVDLEHSALTKNLWRDPATQKVKGYDFVNNDDTPEDEQGHGTHCAGIIAAENTGADGMTGVGEELAPGKVKILPIKVLDKRGAGATDAINKGIRYAMAQKADVISMSLGGGVEFQDLLKSSGAESPILRDAIDAGIIVVVAAGNENCPLGGNCSQQSLLVLSQTIKQYTVLPCSYNGTICVGASDPDASLASYSNFASSSVGSPGVDPNLFAPDTQRLSPDIVAPGTAIYSTYLKNTYKSLDGTSMATPYVAGLAALFKLKVQANRLTRDGNAQRTFRTLLQESQLALSAESDQVRGFVGQVDLAYFMKKIQELNGGQPAGSRPTLTPVENKESGESGAAPNVLSALCGA